MLLSEALEATFMYSFRRFCVKSRDSRLFQPPKRPRSRASPRARRSFGDLLVGVLRHEAAAEVGIEGAEVVLVFEAELGAARV